MKYIFHFILFFFCVDTGATQQPGQEAVIRQLEQAVRNKDLAYEKEYNSAVRQTNLRYGVEALDAIIYRQQKMLQRLNRVAEMILAMGFLLIFIIGFLWQRRYSRAENIKFILVL